MGDKLSSSSSSSNTTSKDGKKQQQQQQQQEQSSYKQQQKKSSVPPKQRGAEETNAVSNVATSSSSPPSTTHTPTPTSSSDVHPFSRGSVIEVLYGVTETDEDEIWWSESSDEEVDNEKPAATQQHEQQQQQQQQQEELQSTDAGSTSTGTATSSVRLCDIIDRVPVPNQPGKWRYYVHYRDFNRRMDAWVGMEQIVSPPSVGNAKARALKKKEEAEKRKKQRQEEAKRAENQPRASRRRSAIEMDGGGAGGATGGAGAADGEKPSRMTRRLRRKSSFMASSEDADDSATVVAGNTPNPDRPDTPKNAPGSSAGGGTQPPEVVKINAAMAPTATVGENVVQTIQAQELDEHEGLDEASLREHEEVTKVKNVSFLELGQFRMETWYFSPLPKELLSEKGYLETLYVCEFSFGLFARKSELLRFQKREFANRPTCRHPPGNEIYRCGNLSMFEVDGFTERIYCQNLCYIAKLFLDHKTLYYDVDPFLFYVLCEVDNRGFHPVGYYSKEKYSDVGYNLACILTFPSHQRKGYGRFLIAFSYELSKREEKVGSPEKPMSDLGQQAYKPYWMSTIVDFLLNKSDGATSMSIMDISKKTSIMAEDIVFTLNQLGILKIINGVYFIAAEQSLLERLAKKHPVKKPRVDPTKLHWTPYITDIKRDKFSIHSKKPTLEGEGTTTSASGHSFASG